ncbi:cytochrome c1 [Rhodobacter sp. KR11]|uniref:cytochrome c1 n=1 Tax=Rhodobacter sp. KR11 TaxID=2974588 RepID=UPI002221F5CB|nr:cytochrome c1 [Rhodobacter sp. KR11]MCW1918232.1 cytochrome c1 [Rhodobacter sp. KR11]
MFRKIAIGTLSALVLGLGPVQANEAGHIEDIAFSFEGPFGKFDEHQLQRGLQVYTEVCSACHGMKFLRFGSLSEPGGVNLTEDAVKAYAKGFTVVDAITGEDREATPADRFPANTGAGAPDLSVMAKARKGFSGPHGLVVNQLVNGIGGPEYIYSMLTGFTGETKEQAGTVLYENKAFPGGWMSMPNEALAADAVTYADGTEASLHQMSEDVAAFLMWASEPRMMVRKESGMKAVLILGLLSVLLYLTNKRLWSRVKGKKLA